MAAPATAAIRSLKDCVGLAVSSLSHRSMPSRFESRSARISGVQPAGQAVAVGAHRQQRRVAPQGRRPGGDLVAGDGPPDDVPVVGDVERTVAAVALLGEP